MAVFVGCPTFLQPEPSCLYEGERAIKVRSHKILLFIGLLPLLLNIVDEIRMDNVLCSRPFLRIDTQHSSDNLKPILPGQAKAFINIRQMLNPHPSFLNIAAVSCITPAKCLKVGECSELFPMYNRNHFKEDTAQRKYITGSRHEK
jgi:hypothetical protein